MKLIEPSITYRTSYEALIADFKDHQVPLVPWILKREYKNFDDLIKRMENYAQGIDLGSYVQNRTFWLINEDDEMVGVSNLRLTLNDKLLQVGGHIGLGIKPSSWGLGYGTTLLSKTIQKARTEGIDDILVTCDKSNVGSAKVIMKNGGVLESEEEVDGFDDIIQRYWIKNE